MASELLLFSPQLTVLNAGRRYLGVKDLAGKVFVTSGLGGMSGAQAKAAVIVGCIGVIAEVSPAGTLPTCILPQSRAAPTHSPLFSCTPPPALQASQGGFPWQPMPPAFKVPIFPHGQCLLIPPTPGN